MHVFTIYKCSLCICNIYNYHSTNQFFFTVLPGQRIGPGDNKCKALEIVQIIWGQIVEQKDDEIGNIIRGPSEIVKVKESNDPDAKYVDKHIHQSRLLFVAAAFGNTKLITELIQSCPELIWKIDDNDQTIFHVAVAHRQESVYNLLYEIGSITDLVTSFTDKNDNNILHLAAMLPEQTRLCSVSGVALQMQRELLWYKVNFLVLTQKFSLKESM